MGRAKGRVIVAATDLPFKLGRCDRTPATADGFLGSNNPGRKVPFYRGLATLTGSSKRMNLFVQMRK